MGKKRIKISTKEKLICDDYLTNYLAYNGSFIKAYMHALKINDVDYTHKRYKTISVVSCKMFNKQIVKDYLAEHTSLSGLNKEFVNLKLIDLITSDKQHIALNAIKLYYQIFQNFTEKIEITNDNIDLTTLTDDELKLYLEISKKIKGNE